MFETLDLNFLAIFMVNLIAVILLVCGGYLRLFTNTKEDTFERSNRDYAASFLLFSVGVFIVTYQLHSVDISMGFAFGLFAVFSMLRYRTESISVKEMTYLFLVIGVSLLSAVGPLSLPELSVLHLIVIVSAVICENLLAKPTLMVQQIQYESIEYVKPQDRSILIDDLRQRTGLNIQSVEIHQIDYVRDITSLSAFYFPDTSKADLPSTSAMLNAISMKS